MLNNQCRCVKRVKCAWKNIILLNYCSALKQSPKSEEVSFFQFGFVQFVSLCFTVFISFSV